MHYFKNVELTKLYPVSESAVRKWIEATRQGKLPLQLYDHKGKPHIANSANNLRIIESLVERGKKYKNTRAKKVVRPSAGFYELYTRKQVFDIISNIELYREIPHQYSYFDGGAEYWDKYATRLWKEDAPNTLTRTIELLRANFGNLDNLLEGYDKVNVIDLGVGNGLPVKELISHLLYDQAVLGRYIGIDISKDMLDIARRNVNKWFGDKVRFEAHERDFSYELFDDLTVEDTYFSSSRTANLVLCLGVTLPNFRSPDDILRVIHRSMGKNDLLITSTKLDSEDARRYFDFAAGPDVPRLAQDDEMLLDLLGINEDTYEVEQLFDEVKKARFIRVRLKMDVTIEFEFPEGKYQVELYKGETILLWRAWHQTTSDVIEQFDKNGFSLLEASATHDRQYLLTVSEIDGSSKERA